MDMLLFDSGVPHPYYLFCIHALMQKGKRAALRARKCGSGSSSKNPELVPKLRALVFSSFNSISGTMISGLFPY